jgi:hypothetical protein
VARADDRPVVANSEGPKVPLTAGGAAAGDRTREVAGATRRLPENLRFSLDAATEGSREAGALEVFSATATATTYSRAAGALEAFTVDPHSITYKQTPPSPESFDADLRLTTVPASNMGYACPVCETPQRDGEHLAHHLAFTAMLHGDDHEAWLDDRVPDWSERDPAGLAAEVTPHAEDAEYREVFEDTADRDRPDVDLGDHDHAGHGHPGHDHAGHDHAAGGGPGAVDSTGETDPEVAEAIREARRMVREGGDDEGDESDSTASDADDPSA